MLSPAKTEKSQPPFATPGIRLYIPSRDTLGSEPATRLIPTFIYPDFTTSNYPGTKRPLSAGISGSNCRSRSRVPTNSKRLDPRPSALFHTKPRNSSVSHIPLTRGLTTSSLPEDQALRKLRRRGSRAPNSSSSSFSLARTSLGVGLTSAIPMLMHCGSQGGSLVMVLVLGAAYACTINRI